MSNLNWNQVKADFHDANQSMATGSGALSQAGTIFGQLRKSILDEEQRAVDNAYREKLFNENVRQFGLEHALKEDQFREGVRQFGITSTETERHNKATEANARAGNQLAADRFAWEKQQYNESKRDLQKIGEMLSGDIDDRNRKAYAEQHADEIKTVNDYRASEAEMASNVQQRLAENIQEQKALEEKLKNVDASTRLANKHPNLDAEIAEAEKTYKEAQAAFNEASTTNPSTRARVEASDRMAAAQEKIKQLKSMQGVIATDTAEDPATLTKRLAMLQQEATNLQNYKPTANPEIDALEKSLKDNAPKSIRAQMISNPALLYAYAAKVAPSQAHAMLQMWQNDMKAKQEAENKASDRQFKEYLVDKKIGADKQKELLKMKSDIPSEVEKLGMDPDYAPYFERVVQNAMLYAAEKDVGISVKELVNIVKQSLKVQKTITGESETNNPAWLQNIVGGTWKLREQAATMLGDEVNDAQLQKIVDWINRQKIIQDYKKNKQANK